ncbi:MAG: hypothetical protein JNM93_07920 [Bacteriovoracaceae bacterium]|nr:hypothetical protein [Bacteriovoracaceae bacterium]
MNILKVIYLIGFVSFSSFAQETVGIFYYKNVFGHVHSKSDRTSTSLTNMSCGHPVKVVQYQLSTVKGWSLVSVGDVKGYVETRYLDQKRPDCFQNAHPKFFNALNLDLNELYYWGRLYDQYLDGESRIQ